MGGKRASSGRRLPSLRQVDDPQLRPLPPAVAIDGKRAGEVDGRATQAGQRLAELLADRAEGDPVDRRAVDRAARTRK